MGKYLQYVFFFGIIQNSCFSIILQNNPLNKSYTKLHIILFKKKKKNGYCNIYVVGLFSK